MTVLTPHGKHVSDKKIVMSIPVYIGKIYRHGGHAKVPYDFGAGLLKPPTALIDPELVDGVKKIVANINIRKIVAIDIAHDDAQPPIHGRLCNRFAAGIQKPAVRPANRLEPSRAKVLV